MNTNHVSTVPLKEKFPRPEVPRMEPSMLVKGKYREGDRRCMTGWMLDTFLDSDAPFVDAYKEFRCEMMDQMYRNFSEDHANTPEQRSKLWNATAKALGYTLVVAEGMAAPAEIPLKVELLQCSRASCGYILTDGERPQEPRDGSSLSITTSVCPKCGNDSFYTLNQAGQKATSSMREALRDGIDPKLIEPSPKLGPKNQRMLLAAKRRILGEAAG